MSLAFSRSLRSLESDSYRNALLGLLLLMPIFLAWLAWFIVGDIALHQVSRELVFTREGLVAVTFEEGLPPLVDGTPAHLIVTDENGESPRTFSASVHRFVTNADGSTVAHLYVEDDLPAGFVTEASIEVESVSPVRFLWEMMDAEE